MENTSVKKKGKRKLNVIDVVIILLMIALVGTMAYRIYTEITNGESARQSNIIVTFEAQVEDDGILDYLKNGDKVYFVTDKTQLGTLYDGAADDGLGAVYKKLDEKAESDASVGKTTICGTLRLVAEARKSQNGDYYVIDGRNISVGSKLDVYTDTAVLRITIKAIGAASN